MTYAKCAAQHFGPWMIEPRWFTQAVNAVKAGTFQPQRGVEATRDVAEPDHVYEAADGDSSEGTSKTLYYRENGVARIPLVGQITKGESSFGGASSVRARKAVRMAAEDPKVHSILMHIDSPGGTVSGTGDLADDVHKANAVKPVYTYFEDLGASAAYWVGSQARKVYANPTAQVGSIGTMAYLEDTSGAYEKAGIKVHLVATGKFKGAWVDGLPISEEYLQTVREEVNDLNDHFMDGVMRGRAGKLTTEQLASVADGRVWIADKAKQLGLIDEVSTLDAVMAAIQEDHNAMITREQFDAFAAENPEAVERFMEQGRNEAMTLLSAPAKLDDLKAEFPGESAFIIDNMDKSMDQARAAFADVLRSRLAEAQESNKALVTERDELKARLASYDAGQRGVPLPPAADAKPVPTDPKAAAESKWEAMSESERSQWISRDIFIRSQK